MSTVEEQLSARLRELPSDVLAEVLVRQTKGNPRLRERLVDLTTNAKERSRRVVRALGGLRRSTPVRSIHEVPKHGRKLHEILNDIRALANSSPPRAFELVCEFIFHDTVSIRIVHDPLGHNRYIYRQTAPAIAAEIAHLYSDSSHMIKCLLPLLAEDPIGARSRLIEYLGPVVNASVLQTALDVVDARLSLPHLSPLPQKGDLYYIKRSLLLALRDADAFVEWCTDAGVLDVVDTLALVRMLMSKAEYDIAERWLDTLKSNAGVILERQTLQLAIDKALGRETPLGVYYRERFLAKPDVKTFATLASEVSKSELDHIIDGFQKQVATAPKIKASTLQVFIAAGRGSIAVDIVAKRCTYADATPNSWSRLAQVFSDADLPLGAYIAYRVLLNSILDHKRSEVYYRGVMYYQFMWSIAPHIVDWRGVQDHTTYMQDIFTRHAEQSRFWLRAELSIKPPKVSRFSLPIKQRYKWR